MQQNKIVYNIEFNAFSYGYFKTTFTNLFILNFIPFLIFICVIIMIEKTRPKLTLPD